MNEPTTTPTAPLATSRDAVGLAYFVVGWIEQDLETAGRQSKNDLVESLAGLRAAVLERVGGNVGDVHNAAQRRAPR